MAVLEVLCFRCAENECTAAFTTKQCLQFHYKKVHGYSQDRMPKIERSVAYTFDAYAGGDPVDEEEENKGGNGSDFFVRVICPKIFSFFQVQLAANVYVVVNHIVSQYRKY
jgi:hypothetical protein